jgi:hypothetical protein
MRAGPAAKALILSLVLCCGALGCGKYGPPVRSHQRPPPATAPLDADDTDDESEPEPDQP